MDHAVAQMSIGEAARRCGVATSTLRYYEESGLLKPAARVSGRRRYDESCVTRLEVIGLCKAAGFTLDEIKLLFADEEPGRPASRALAELKLADIDARLATLAQARSIVEWGMRCSCPSIDDCHCGVHPRV